MTVRSGWLLNASEATPGQSRQDTRLSPLGTYTPVDALTSRGGVIPGGTGLNLTGSGMVGTLAVGRAVLQGTTSQGAYPVVVSQAETFTVANGDPSNPRIDRVFLVVYDKLFDTSGQYLALVVVTQGTPAASPTAPTAPATGTAYLPLWDILVPAGASAGSPINWATALTDRRTYTSAVGGINPDGATAGAYARQYRDGGSTTGLERYTGSAWESRVYLGTSGQLVIGTDTNLRRFGPNVLGTDDGFTVGGGDLTLSSGRPYRNKASSAPTTVANTTTETVIATMTIPANESQYAVYRLKAFGTIANAAATPNHQWKLRIGGVAGALMATISYTFGTASSGTRTWSMEALVTILTTGVSGSWFGQMTGTSNLNTNTTIISTQAPVIQDGTAAQTKDTTVAQDLVITSNWGTANAANTLTCQGYTAERVS